MNESKGRLGDLLLGLRQLTEQQIDQALESQRDAGGRLGTCLLEVDAIDEAAVLAALSLQSRRPFASAGDLQRIPTEVIARIPSGLAVRCCAIPFADDGRELSVAMLDPDDLAVQDDLSFASGRRIVPHAALELRLREAIDRHYHQAAPQRYRQLWDHLHRRQFLWDGSRPEIEAPQTAPW
ncbi:MAG: hypothetical protein AAF604_13630 [Acidobacteriota bacterium]